MYVTDFSRRPLASNQERSPERDVGSHLKNAYTENSRVPVYIHRERRGVARYGTCVHRMPSQRDAVTYI